MFKVCLHRETGQAPWRRCLMKDQICFSSFVEGHLMTSQQNYFEILSVV